MNEQNTHNNNNPEVVENYKEEGMLTVETLDIASHDATAHTHKKHKHGGFTLTTPVAIIIAAIIISGGLMGYGAITSGGNTSSSLKPFAGRAIDSTDYIYGKENSKIIVVEYSDTECPFCVQLSPTIKQLKSEYGDKVAFTFRYFPLTQIHKNAVDESRAIECAGVVGGKEKYYAYIDEFFGYKMSKQTTQLPKTGKEDIAKSIGLNMSEFANCMSTKQTEKKVLDSINDGIAAGVQGTPSTFILLKTRKGYDVVTMVDGARPYEFFKAALDEALNR